MSDLFYSYPSAPLSAEDRERNYAVLDKFVEVMERWDDIQALIDRPPRSGELSKVVNRIRADHEALAALTRTTTLKD